MNNDKLIDLGNSNFVYTKSETNNSKHTGESYILDLDTPNILKFSSGTDIKLIKKVSDDEIVVVLSNSRDTNYKKNDNDFKHYKLNKDGIKEIYSCTFNPGKIINPREIIVRNTNTFLLTNADRKTCAYNSDLKTNIEADRIEKKIIKNESEEKEILDATSYIKRGNISDMIKFYIDPKSFDVKGFYSRIIDSFKFYTDPNSLDIKGFNLNIEDINKICNSDATFIPVYTEKELNDDEEYKKIETKGEKFKYRLKKTYDNKIEKYLNILHMMEKTDSYERESKAEKMLTLKYFNK